MGPDQKKQEENKTQIDWLTAKRDGVDESMLFRGANPLALAGLAVGKTGVTGALPRRSPQAFS